jgi:tRNA threonylcarbamoyl adenosine modification protein YeaZ
MTLLAIDTATDRASVALGRGVEETLEEHLDGARRHAAALLPMIARLLARAEASLDDVRAIVLADGPGSFTGLRVGATVAKALSLTRGIPVLVAPSLMARGLAAAAGSDRPVLVTSDALRGDAYAAVYRYPAGAVETLVPPGVYPRAGLGALAPAGALDAAAQPAQASALVGLAGLKGGAVPVADVAGWEPVYGRPAEAQAQWERTHGRPLSGAAGLAG